MAASNVVRVSIKEKAKTYLNLWYIGETVNTIDEVADDITSRIVKDTARMMDKQIMHLVNHTDTLTKVCEELAEERCIPKALGVSRPAKRENVDLKKSRTSQAEAESIIKELMSINPYEVIRYVSADGVHEVKVSRGMGNPFIRVDGRPLRTHEYLLRVLKRNEWVRQD